MKMAWTYAGPPANSTPAKSDAAITFGSIDPAANSARYSVGSASGFAATMVRCCVPNPVNTAEASVATIRRSGHSWFTYWAPFFLAGVAMLVGIPVYARMKNRMTEPGPVPEYR